MQIRLGTIITAGILASISIVLFLFLVPSVLGMGPIDITNEMGRAISGQSPRIAGTILMAILGVLYSGIFAKVYNMIPGRFITKGIIYGFVIGLFSIYVLPGMLTAINGVFGLSGQITANFATPVDTHFMLMVTAYLVFGLTLATTAKPAESEA